MFNVEDLYFSESFENLLKMLSRKARVKIVDYEDFKQDVFLEILDSNIDDRKGADRVAKRVAQRWNREYESSLDNQGNVLRYSYNDNIDSYFDDIDGKRESPLWEDNNRLA